MGYTTDIEWTDHTANAWWGCRQIVPECDNCYAKNMARAFGHNIWNNDLYRSFNERHFQELLAWDRKCGNGQSMKTGLERHTIFMNDMSDTFDMAAPESERRRVFELMRQSPGHDFQLLTKRPGQARSYLPKLPGWPWPNVWLGTSVGTRQSAESFIPILRTVPAAIRFLSVEPLLEDIGLLDLDGIDWVILGGESGAGARPMELDWLRRVIRQCEAQGVRYFVKQLGKAWAMSHYGSRRHMDAKGGNMDEWPEDLRVRQFPLEK